MVRFQANNVAVIDLDEKSILVGFAEERDGQVLESLIFQREHEFDVQDVAHGWNQVYVERNDQIQAGYGGIEQVVLSTEYVRVVLSGRTAESIGDGEFVIGLSLTPEEFERLRQGLRIVFREFGTLVERLT
jgi:hypothetical protein